MTEDIVLSFKYGMITVYVNAIFVLQTEAHQDTLVSEQASFILERSGIGNVYNMIQDQPSQKVFTIYFCK